MLDHIKNGEWEIAIDANCIQSGKQVKRCIKCETVLETKAIPKLSRFFSEWTAADSNPLVEERICNICGTTETREILEESEKSENSNMFFVLLLLIATSVNHIVFYSNRNKNRKKTIYICNIAVHYMIILLFFTSVNKVSVINFLMFIVLPIILIFAPESLVSRLFAYLGALGVSAISVIEIWHNLDWYLLPLIIEYIGFVFVIKVRNSGN